MNTNPTTFDIIIVGGGIVGLTLACGLQPTGKKIALLDAKDLSLLTQAQTASNAPSDIEEKAPAFSAINRTSQHLFEQWGLWPAIKAEADPSPFKSLFVWDAKGKGSVHFNNEIINAQSMGHIIQNQKLRYALYSRLEKAHNITLLSSASVAKTKDSIVVDYPQAYLTLDDGQRLKAELLIGADGGHSTLRTQSGMTHYSRPYGQSALTATVLTEYPHQKTAWQCFLPEGPLAFLPLNHSHQCSIVWSTLPEHADHLQSRPLNTFNESLTQAFEGRLGKIKRLSALSHYPLTLRHAKHYTKPCIALVGDAIHTIHPLAGQGVNLGLKDAQALAEQIQQAIMHNKPLGHQKYLRAYERARKGDNWTMIAAMELFKRLFSDVPDHLITLRSLGLNTVDRLDCIKRIVMN